MDSKEFVRLVARVCVSAFQRREASYDMNRHHYKLQVYDAIELAIAEICPDLGELELCLVRMCAGGGFQGEFVDWAEEVLGKGA